MTDDELSDALDGLYAYDQGSIDSGIHDARLRARVVAEILAMPKDENQLYPDRLARIAREMWLSEEAIAAGYGLEEVHRFVDWLQYDLLNGAEATEGRAPARP